MPQNRYSPYSFFLIAIADLVFLIGLFFLFLFIHDPTWERSFHGLMVFAKVHYKSLILIVLFWLLLSAQTKLYKRFRFSGFLDVFKRIIFHVLLFGVVLFAISGGKSESLYTLKESVFFLSILFFYLLLNRFIIYKIIKLYRLKGYNYRNLVILGYNDNAQRLEELLAQKKEFGLKIKDTFVTHNPKDNQKLLDLSKLGDYLSVNEIDFAYISLGNGMDEQLVDKTVDVLQKNYVSVGFIPSSLLETRQSLELNYLDSFPIFSYKRLPLDYPVNQLAKRVFDLVFTLLVFGLLLWWIIPIVSLAVYISQGSPIFFSQKRNGLNGNEFKCLKFRTMKEDKDNNKIPTKRDDPRVTKLGRFLRETSIDELPQFFNVLKGEMSIVGPRPHMVSENESYGDIIQKYSLRHYVKPGITGLSQIRGYRGAIDSPKDMEMRVKTDIYYVRNWSFLLDFYIVFKTGVLLFRGDDNAI